MIMRLLSLLTCAFVSAKGHACQCARATVEDGRNSFPRIFGARVVKAEVNKWNVDIYIDNFVAIKGEKKPLRKIKTPLGESACGIAILVPGSYVFFAKEDGSIDRCGSTRTIEDPSLGDLAIQVVNEWAGLKND